MGLGQVSDNQLINLFRVSRKHELTTQGRAILSELMYRGYFFDVRQGDFLTRHDWKQRYRGEEPPAPADYILYLRQQMQPVVKLQ
jgi:hypothetical protein